ncbi:origin recognition complex subunit 3 N-terminus-domain-containing protein [Obelidium mucronatum]|nr:origin recognition complex subunit 3 N-terminus-domain-containing protein [Obelidium mucronatum]
MFHTLTQQLVAESAEDCFNLAVLRPLNSQDIKSCIKSLIAQFLSNSASKSTASDAVMSPGGKIGYYAAKALLNAEAEQEMEKSLKNSRTAAEDELLDTINRADDDEDLDLDGLAGGGDGKSFTDSILYQNGRKYSPYDIRVLESWFSRKSKKAKESTVLVISIPEFERFDTDVFQDLVKLCSSCLDTLPFVFILGISTTLDIIQNNLHRSVIRLLRCERFFLSKSDDCVDAIVTEVFLKNHDGFKLNHDAFSLIFNSYKSNHRSVTALCDAIQYFALKHFYGDSLSSLITHDGVSQIQPELLDRMRKQKSFNRHVKALLAAEEYEEVRLLCFDDNHLTKTINAAKVNLGNYHFMMAFTIQLLRSTRAMLKLNNQNTVYNIYSRVLSSDCFVREAFVQEMVRKLKWIKPMELAGILGFWVELFQHCNLQNQVESYITEIQALLKEFESKYKTDGECDGDDDGSDRDDFDEELRFQKAQLGTPNQRKTKVSLKAGVLGPDKNSYDFFALRACQIFEKFLGETMKHHTDYLFNEIYYYQEAAKVLMKNFQPHPRPITQIALGAASDYLTCTCCKASDVLHPKALDISLLYKLHSECGHMINLFDLFISFEQVLRKESPCPSQTDIQVRFAAGLTHLEYMGFIKPTARKTDHVSKNDGQLFVI